MSLLAEEIVEEWLNRNGYFTIRGIRLGVDEIDILAIKPGDQFSYVCRHIEVQSSINPISYISKVPKEIRKKTGVGANNAKKRDMAQLRQGVKEWVQAKFHEPRKVDLRNALCPHAWSLELVVGKVKHEEELSLIRDEGITTTKLSDIIAGLKNEKTVISSAAGADLIDLMFVGR